MFTEWIIDGLAKDYVDILKRRYIEDEGEKLQVGEDWRTSAQNSLEGREFIKSIVPENFYNSILAVWGDSPSVIVEETPAIALQEIDPDTEQI